MALDQVQTKLQDDEMIFAFLIDIYVISDPERVTTIFELVNHVLKTHSNIVISLGKT